MSDATPQCLVDGAVSLDLVPLIAPKQTALARVLVVIFLLQVDLCVLHIRKWNSNLKIVAFPLLRTRATFFVLFLVMHVSLYTVMTALALLSEKSIPSLTLPRHTARNSAPVIPCSTAD